MERSPGSPEDSKVIIRTLACVLQKLVDVNRKVSGLRGVGWGAPCVSNEIILGWAAGV
jgi:hypothetical protein